MGDPDNDLALLMERYLAGDVRAFRRLYQLVGPYLYRFIGDLCARDAALTGEVLRQTFKTIHSTRHAYVAGADPLPWFRAVAQGCHRDATAPRPRNRRGSSGRFRQLWRRIGPAATLPRADA